LGTAKPYTARMMADVASRVAAECNRGLQLHCIISQSYQRVCSEGWRGVMSKLTQLVEMQPTEVLRKHAGLRSVIKQNKVWTRWFSLVTSSNVFVFEMAGNKRVLSTRTSVLSEARAKGLSTVALHCILCNYSRPSESTTPVS
jgi:hypothetical protein